MASDKKSAYMMARNYSDYAYSIRVTWKGFEIDFQKIQSALGILDFSNNNFTGEIPKLLGKLNGLLQLNLSHNSLRGQIPLSLGMLFNLESLDLSSNLLTGRIPQQLAFITFLAVLNLSHNQLEGAIPRGKQFQTFSASSFEGNLGLCGFPMPNCNRDISPPRGVKQAMEMQAEAERRKRAQILESEGLRQANINIADGHMSAQILASQALKAGESSLMRMNLILSKLSLVTRKEEAARAAEEERRQKEEEEKRAAEAALQQKKLKEKEKKRKDLRQEKLERHAEEARRRKKEREKEKLLKKKQEGKLLR
uniref:Uncharacterized protein n=1 Tax=Salix viminalis TaxID=40686 RepID=A0A6N2LWL0_SALVM